MDYRESLDFMFSQLPMFQRTGPAAYKADLGNTLQMCRLLGHPEATFSSVHVAGTNGKGSVSHLIASALQEAGYKTGLYTSPHLKEFRERIRIDGQMIPEDKVVRFIDIHRQHMTRIGLSFFEMTVGMAFDHFRQETVDIAVIETGMGGRLDSTNVLSPLLSVITNIGLDHMQFLGNTLQEIAQEKAAIIKAGIPAIIGETQESVKHVFEARASAMKTGITFADRLPLSPVKPGLAGSWQLRNARTAHAALKALAECGYIIEPEHIATGFRNVVKNTGILGRWQVLGQNPLAICDIGHNREGLQEVVKKIGETPHDKLHFVIGMVADKHIEPALELLPASATYYFCKADIPRALNAAQLKQKANASGLNGNTYASVKDAYRAAIDNADRSDLVFVGGSTFVVAEIL